jgi:hypothetical protein
VFADVKLPVKLEIVNYDTESKPDVARTQAEKAIDAGCQMLVGAFDSGQTIAIAQVAEQRGVPLVVEHRRCAADHRAGLQVRRAQLPDGADADHRRAGAAQGDLQGLGQDAQDRRADERQRHVRHRRW